MSRGGIRGIAELEVLSQIQKKLGVQIPISAFFDLIVGTRSVYYSIETRSHLTTVVPEESSHWRLP
jgi:hypothetical protein